MHRTQKINESKIINLLLHRHKIDHENTKFNYSSKHKLKSCIFKIFRLTRMQNEFAIFFIKNNFFS